MPGRRAGTAPHLETRRRRAIHLNGRAGSEELHHLRAHHEAAPDEILDARWAGVILERALTNVRREFSAEGKAEMFEALSPFLAGEQTERLIRAGADAWRLIRRIKTHDPSSAPAIRGCGAAGDHADGERAARSGR